jgi:hypothetical protein
MHAFCLYPAATTVGYTMYKSMYVLDLRTLIITDSGESSPLGTRVEAAVTPLFCVHLRNPQAVLSPACKALVRLLTSTLHTSRMQVYQMAHGSMWAWEWCPHRYGAVCLTSLQHQRQLHVCSIWKFCQEPLLLPGVVTPLYVT